VTGTPRTAGRLIADALAAAGVRVAYTVPGESFLTLLDGLGAAGIRVVATRHEGAAAHMAAASAALSAVQPSSSGREPWVPRTCDSACIAGPVRDSLP